MTHLQRSAAARGHPIVSLGQRRLAIIGYGKLGHACAHALSAARDLTLAGIVEHEEDAGLPPGCVSHVSELEGVDVALLCVPASVAAEVARELLQARIALVECASFEGDALHAYYAELARRAALYRARAVVGAGWETGVRAHLQRLFELLIPKGRTQVHRHVAAGLHHTAAAAALPEVRDALCAELRAPHGATRRIVYVEFEPGADVEHVSARIAGDPLFADAPTQVLPVPDLAALAGDHRGLLLERRDESAGGPHSSLLFEARLETTEATARIMLDAARAMPHTGPRAWRYTPFGLVPVDVEHARTH